LPPELLLLPLELRELIQSSINEQLGNQKMEQELAKTQRELESEQLEKQKKEQELAYKQKQLELIRIENEKKSILADYSDSPFIMGLTDGELTFYVQPLPSYASQDVRNQVEDLASWMDGKTMYKGTKLKRVYQNSFADFSVNWVKDYQEDAIGRQVGDHLLVGLGTSNCYGDWMPFDGYTVYKIMWHEVGHALGYAHVSDSNNIMYEHGTGNKFDLEYEDRITLPDGSSQKISLCHGGSFFYSTKTSPQSDGYKVYAVPPNTSSRDIINLDASFYLDCSRYKNAMISASGECNVASGSYLLIYNPTTFGFGDTVIVDLEIYDRTPNKRPDFDFDESHMFFSQDLVNRVKTLFRN